MKSPSESPAPTYAVLVGGPGVRPYVVRGASGLTYEEACYRAERLNREFGESLPRCATVAVAEAREAPHA